MLNDIFRYLNNPNGHIFLQPQKAQLTASLSCVLYLQSSLDFVDPRVTEEAKRLSVLLCLHDLNLYAIDHWLDHLLALSRSMVSWPDRREIEPLLQSLERLAEIHQSIAALRGSGLLEEEEQDYRQQGQHWQLFGISHAARILLNRVLVHQQAVSSEDYPPQEPHSIPAALRDSNSLMHVSPAIDPNAHYQYPLLFSPIRERYQNIVEELMKTEEPHNQTLSAFILRQASGAFLCRYRGCPRAAQGFHNSDLREKHEESHRPRFQCAHATCGLFGTTFNSRAAMKKHGARYHDEDNTASVPNSLTRKPRRVHENRTLFAFSDAKTKRKAEESRIREEYSETPQASFKGQTTVASSDNRNSASEEKWGTSMFSTNASERHVYEAVSDVYPDTLYNPGLAPITSSLQPRQPAAQDIVSPHRSNLSDLIRLANTKGLVTRSASPVSNSAQYGSPFRESSQFYVEGGSSSTGISAATTRLPSVDRSILQQEREDAHAHTEYRPPSPLDFFPKKPVGLNEVYLDYNNIEEDAEIPFTYSPEITDNPDSYSSSIPQTSDPGFLFVAPSAPPILQQYPFISKSRRQRNSMRRDPDRVPDFPASLTSMESSKSEPSHLYSGIYDPLIGDPSPWRSNHASDWYQSELSPVEAIPNSSEVSRLDAPKPPAIPLGPLSGPRGKLRPLSKALPSRNEWLSPMRKPVRKDLNQEDMDGHRSLWIRKKVPA